jgi:molybdopterin converting factor small subunit
MNIDVQLFSILRECLPPDADRGRAIITLPHGASVADLISHLGIDRQLGFEPSEIASKAGWQVMISGSYEPDMGRTLQDGDQVRIFPPMAGG